MGRENGADPWMRSAVTLRLTPERKTALRGICSDPGAAPTAAIDAAIELARAVQRATEIEDATSIVAAPDPQRESHARVERAIKALTRDVGSMKQAFLAALSSENFCERYADSPILAPTPTPLREWLDAAKASSALVVAQVSWTSTLRVDSASANLHFSLKRWATRESKTFKGQIDVGITLVLGPLPLANTTLNHALQNAAVLACAKTEKGWSVSAHETMDEGKLRPRSICFEL